MPRRLKQNLVDVQDLTAATDTTLQSQWLLYKNVVQLPGQHAYRPKRMPVKTFEKAVYHLGALTNPHHIVDAGASDAICDELVPDIDGGRFGPPPARDVVRAPGRVVDATPLSVEQQLLREFLSSCATCYTYYSVPVVSGDAST